MEDHALTHVMGLCVNASTDGGVIPAPMPLVFLKIKTIYFINQIIDMNIFQYMEL